MTEAPANTADELKAIFLEALSSDPPRMLPGKILLSESAVLEEISDDILSVMTYKHRKRFRRILRLRQSFRDCSQELGISFDTARAMNERGWSAEKARQWDQHDRLFQRERKLGRAHERALVEKWIEQREPLIRWGMADRWSARLQAQDQYRWKWSDLESWQSKLEILAIFPRTSYAGWSGAFQIDPEVRDQKRKIMESRRERFEVLPLFWIDACHNRQRCRLTFLNGTQLSGFPMWFYKYGVALTPTADSDDPSAVAYFHGLASVEKLAHSENE